AGVECRIAGLAGLDPNGCRGTDPDCVLTGLGPDWSISRKVLGVIAYFIRVRTNRPQGGSLMPAPARTARSLALMTLLALGAGPSAVAGAGQPKDAQPPI